jgi:hypothetical protein
MRSSHALQFRFRLGQAYVETATALPDAFKDELHGECGFPGSGVAFQQIRFCLSVISVKDRIQSCYPGADPGRANCSVFIHRRVQTHSQ